MRHAKRKIAAFVAISAFVIAIAAFVMLVPGVSLADDDAAVSPTAPATSETTADTTSQDSSSATSATSTDNATEKQDLSAVNYVLIESPEMTPDDTESVVIGFSDESLAVQQAWLHVVNDVTKQEYEFSSVTTADGAVLFSFSGSELGEGTFVLTSLEYSTDTSSTDREQVVFSDDSQNSYQFIISSATSDEADGSGQEVTAYTVSDDGTLQAEDSVDSAVAVAAEAASSSASTSTTSSSQDSTTGVSTYSTTSSDDVVVVLDAGHGGKDSGAVGYGLQEKDLNLKIALYCQAELEQYSGVTVIMTRTTDTYLTLSERANVAISANADAFVCIHINAGGGTGAEVIVPNDSSYYYQQVHVEATDLADKILAQLTALGINNRGAYSKDSTNGSTFPDGSIADYFTVIDETHEAGIPGIIVEHSFIDNASDAAFLSDESNLQALGVADATGIAQHFGLSKGPSPEDFWAVYDYDYYIEHNSDVANAFGGDEQATFNHFLEYGMSEGRQASPLFNPYYYKEQYSDLSDAYGSDMSSYYYHFMTYGMDEGRQASEDFDVVSYYNAGGNADLRRAYGTSGWQQYYRHYLEWGQYEDRVTTGVDELENYVTVYAGVDWSPVYDGEYYAENNPDVKSFATVTVGDQTVLDDAVLLKHFYEWGMDEGRQASEDFNVVTYYYNYEDLRLAYGSSSWRPYYLHYIEWGQAEGRDATGTSASTAIMGESQASASQMVTLFNSKGYGFPSSVYSSKGASTIDEFCNILCEEAEAEGVRAEVLYGQVMYETGWLQFGGDVSADQCNFGGLGATGGGAGGATFPDVRTGLRAQVQHLKAYASTDALNNECVDPRFNLVTRGIAPTLEDLNGRWAVPGTTYGQDIAKIINQL
jgi:N-acetylmuramoyl-L-alanine amidase